MPSDGHFELTEHGDRAGCIEQSDFLGRADHDCTGQRQRLGERERDITRTRGQVDHEVIEVSPVDLAKELLHDSVEHRPAHDDCFFGLEQKTHRHQLQAVGLDRLNAIASRHGPAAGSYQVGDRRAVDVGIHQADARSVRTQAIGDCRGHGRFADTPFARTDGNHVLNAGDVTGFGDAFAANLGAHRDMASSIHRANGSGVRSARRARSAP